MTYIIYPNLDAYKVATVLYARMLAGDKELLIPEITYIANMRYLTVWYWLNVFESHGFIRITRHKHRPNKLNFDNRHNIIHLTRPKQIPLLYSMLYKQKWMKSFRRDIIPKEKK